MRIFRTLKTTTKQQPLSLPRPLRVRKPKIYADSHASFSSRQRMRIGAELAASLPVVTPLGETARAFGISKTMLRRIECNALFKVAQAMRALNFNEL